MLFHVTASVNKSSICGDSHEMLIGREVPSSFSFIAPAHFHCSLDEFKQPAFMNLLPHSCPACNPLLSEVAFGMPVLKGLLAFADEKRGYIFARKLNVSKEACKQISVI